jgi:hypothetical protein
VSAGLLVSILNIVALVCYVRVITTPAGYVPDEVCAPTARQLRGRLATVSMATQWAVGQEHLITDEAGNITAIDSEAPALRFPAYTTVCWIAIVGLLCAAHCSHGHVVGRPGPARGAEVLPQVRGRQARPSRSLLHVPQV